MVSPGRYTRVDTGFSILSVASLWERMRMDGGVGHFGGSGSPVMTHLLPWKFQSFLVAPADFFYP